MITLLINTLSNTAQQADVGLTRRKLTVLITGSAVINRKIENSTPCKIVKNVVLLQRGEYGHYLLTYYMVTVGSSCL